jgi:ATP-dependent Lhr-like helicase
MPDAFVNRQSTLLIAPTGGGKTLSGFLPSLIDCQETRPNGNLITRMFPLCAGLHRVSARLPQRLSPAPKPCSEDRNGG